MFATCANMNSAPHWGNSCPLIAQHLSNKKALAVSKRVTKEERAMAAQQTELSNETYITPTIQGYISCRRMPVSPVYLVTLLYSTLVLTQPMLQTDDC
jgi:hypothetical protein